MATRAAKTWPHGSVVTAALLTAAVALSTVGCEYDRSVAPPPPAKRRIAQYPVTYVRPTVPASLPTKRHAFDGQVARIACSGCHDAAGANVTAGEVDQNPANTSESQNEAGADAHGVRLKHGDVTCLMCHSRTDRDALTLADGRTLEFAAARRLCAQCHGPQHRDYLAGSHGGMNGYWDQSQGPRTRNDCTACHDPHRPAWPMVTPLPAPRR